MKRIALVLLGVAMLLALAGCGVREKIEDKITEGIIENIAGENVDIDLDEGTITVEGEEGEEWSLGGGEWPEGQAADLIPEFTKGKITGVMNSAKACFISIEEVEEQDYREYIEALKSAGFDQDVVEASDESMITYGASLEDGSASVIMSYSSDKEMIIQVTASQ